jgi:hypothetical protein
MNNDSSLGQLLGGSAAPRTMPNKCGFAAKIASSKGLLDPPSRSELNKHEE